MSNPATPVKRVLLVGWDSADWKIINTLLEEGGMDGIRSLMNGGNHGNLATLEPQLSPMLWTSIATGKMAYHHGVEGFTEVDPVSGQIVPVSAASRKCKTLWEMLGEHDKRSHVVSWFATQGEQDLDGKMVSNMFGHLKGTTKDMDPADFPPPKARPGDSDGRVRRAQGAHRSRNLPRRGACAPPSREERVVRSVGAATPDDPRGCRICM